MCNNTRHLTQQLQREFTHTDVISQAVSRFFPCQCYDFSQTRCLTLLLTEEKHERSSFPYVSGRKPELFEGKS